MTDVLTLNRFWQGLTILNINKHHIPIVLEYLPRLAGFSSGKSGASAWASKLPGPGSYNTPSTVGEGPRSAPQLQLAERTGSKKNI